MKKELGQEAIYDARQLGTPRMLVLGLQHMFAMFGATVLVPILVQGYGLPLSIQTTLLFAGLGTLLFHVCTKLKIPAFLGSSFAYLGGFETVAKLDAGKYAAMSGEDKLAYALGGVVIAGLLYLVLALLFKLLGARTVMRYFPPIVTGPMIIMIGLNLSGSAINNAATCWWLALVAMAIIVVANIWGKGMVKIIPILLGVVGSYLVALIATASGAQLPDAEGVMQPLVNFAAVSKANLIGLQKFVIAKFDVSAILVMAPIAIAAMMEHIGDVSAISSTTGRNFIEDPGLHRTLVGDGLATAMAGMFGGPANTTYGENTGVLALSKVYDPRVVRLAAIYAIILSFSPKFDALVNSIPAAIVGGVSFILYGMISAVGVRNIVENQVDLTKSRNLIIAAVMFVSGLGFSSVGGVTFTVGGAAVTLSGLAIAALCGVILNAILPGNDYVFGVSVEGDKSADLGSYYEIRKENHQTRRGPQAAPFLSSSLSLRRQKWSRFAVGKGKVHDALRRRRYGVHRVKPVQAVGSEIKIPIGKRMAQRDAVAWIIGRRPRVELCRRRLPRRADEVPFHRRLWRKEVRERQEPRRVQVPGLSAAQRQPRRELHLAPLGVKAQYPALRERHAIAERGAGALPWRAALHRRAHERGGAWEQLRRAVLEVGARVLAIVAVEAPRAAAPSPAARQRHLGAEHRHAAALPCFLHVQRRIRQPQKLSCHVALLFLSQDSV